MLLMVQNNIGRLVV